MKHPILAATVFLLFAAPLVPSTLGSGHTETVTIHYDGAAGTVVPTFGGLSVNCGPDCYGTGLVIGGGDLRGDPGQEYSDAIIQSQDAVWKERTATSACFWNPDGAHPDICQDSDGDVRSGAHCGTIVITDAKHPGNRVTVWVWTLLVTERLAVCGATTGTITGTLS